MKNVLKLLGFTAIVSVSVLLLVVVSDLLRPYEGASRDVMVDYVIYPETQDDWAESANALDVPVDSLTYDLYQAHMKYGAKVLKMEHYMSTIRRMRGQ